MTILINHVEKCLINTKTGDIIRNISCWEDLVAYCTYLISKNREKEVQCILKRVFKGDKVISKMITDTRGH